MKDNFKLLAVRSIVMSLHSFGTGIGQFILPLPILHTIACSGTLFVFIIDYFLNSTPINARQIIGIAVGIFGVLLTSNGKLITQYFDPTYQYNTTYQNYLITDPNLVALFAIVYFLIVVGWAYGIVLTKSAKANVFQINLILGFAFYFESVLVLPCMPYLDYR
jgi:drug/metabolite transporter (DMT)-like permease